MLHKLEIIGNVGKIEQLRYTKNGKAVLNFSVAVNEKFNGQEQTTWYRVTAWNGLSESIADHLVVGQLVYVEGRPEATIWTDRDGIAHANLVVHAATFRYLGGKPQGAGTGADIPPEDDIPW